MNTIEKLSQIQQELKAPKGQRNKFGNYNYRSCEDILEAIKPHLDGGVVTLSDSIWISDQGNYVEATATFKYADGAEIVTAYAREDMSAKGMSPAQMTGAASSYARKYALNGLFCIDDTKDADSTNTHDKEPEEEPKKEPVLVKGTEEAPVTKKDILGYIAVASSITELGDIFENQVKVFETLAPRDFTELKTACTNKKAMLGAK